MFDKAVKPLQEYLADKLPWLDHSIGFCEVLSMIDNRKKITTANLYLGSGEYERIEPCEELGNFCFCMLKDPQDKIGSNLISAPFSLIFWYDVDKVSSAIDERNREAVKGQILSVLQSFRSPYFTFNRIYEKPQNIFNEFSYDFLQNQHLMQPYAGIRIEGTIRAEIPCTDE